MVSTAVGSSVGGGGRGGSGGSRGDGDGVPIHRRGPRGSRTRTTTPTDAADAAAVVCVVGARRRPHLPMNVTAKTTGTREATVTTAQTTTVSSVRDHL